MTLVDLLVAVGLLGILMSLLIPAVQRARETARRVRCAVHLREVGFAATGCMETLKRYPKYIHSKSKVTLSGHVELLPHLGYLELFHAIDLGEDGTAVSEPAFSRKNHELLFHSITAFVCPSDSTSHVRNSYRACFGTSSGTFSTWRPGDMPSLDPSNESIWGVFGGRVTTQDIRDGLSYTALYSERISGDGDLTRYSPALDVARIPKFDVLHPNDVRKACEGVAINAPHFSSSGTTWLIGGLGQTAYNHVLPPNSKIPDCVSGVFSSVRSLGDGAHTARSYHSGGVNLCMADGAVRFVSENVDLKIWRAMATIHGGEMVEGY